MGRWPVSWFYRGFFTRPSSCGREFCAQLPKRMRSFPPGQRARVRKDRNYGAAAHSDNAQMFAVTRYASLRRVRYQSTGETVNDAGTTIATLSHPSYKVTALQIERQPN